MKTFLASLLFVLGSLALAQSDPTSKFTHLWAQETLTPPRAADCSTLKTPQKVGSMCYDTDSDADSDGTLGDLYVCSAISGGTATATCTNWKLNSSSLVLPGSTRSLLANDGAGDFLAVGGDITIDASGNLTGLSLKGIAGGKVKTVGPASDINGDSTVAAGEGRFDYNAASIGGGEYSGQAIQDAIDAVSPTATAPIEIVVYPGTYDASGSAEGVVLVDKSYITLRSAARHAAVIKTSVTGAITIAATTTDVTIDGFRLEDQIFGGGEGSKSARYFIRNILYDNPTDTGSGFMWLDGTEEAPGPYWFVEGVTCVASHYCIDAWGNSDYDSDSTLELYNNVVSVGNYYEVSGYYVMPVGVIGPNVNFWSSGDMYRSDCHAIELGEYLVGTPTLPSTPRIVQISGATFYIGAPWNGEARVDCPNIGPYAITISETNVGADVTQDRATDVLSVTGSSFYIEKEATETSHGVFLHRGRLTKAKFAGNSFTTDNTTNWVPIEFTQTASYTPEVFLQGGTLQWGSTDIFTNHVKGWGESSAGELSTRILTSPGELVIKTSDITPANAAIAFDLDNDGSAEGMLNSSPSNLPGFYGDGGYDTDPLFITGSQIAFGTTHDVAGSLILLTAGSNAVSIIPWDYTGFEGIPSVTIGSAAAPLAAVTATAFSGSTTALTPTDSPPTCDAGVQGTLYYDLSATALYHCNGAAWAAVDASGAGGDDITVDGTATVNPNFSDAGDINFAYSAPNITATVNADSVALSTDTTGNYVQSVATTAPLGGGAAGSEAATLTLTVSNATTGAVGVIQLAGDLSGTGTAPTIAANAVALGTDTTGNYVSSATSSQGLVLTGTEGGSLGLQDCAASEVLKRNVGDTAWECGSASLLDTTGTPANNQVALFVDSDTLEGTPDITWDETTMTVAGAVESTGDGTNNGITFTDNGTEPSAPAAGKTMLYSYGGRLKKIPNGGSARTIVEAPASDNAGVLFWGNSTDGATDTGNLVCATAGNLTCVTTFAVAAPGTPVACSTDHGTGGATYFYALCRRP